MDGHPTRVAHLLPVSLLAELLGPSYANANSRDAIDVFAEVKQGLSAAGLHRPLCDAVWTHLRDAHRDLEDDVLVEKLAKALARKGGPRAKAATKAREEGMTALFAAIDIHIGRAGDAARLALETPAGRKALQGALKKAAEHLALSLKL